MQWGISFRVGSDFDIERWGLPPPSNRRWLTRMDGTKSLSILYHFQYAPQSWKEWQRVASIKVQIKKKIKCAEFEDYDPYEITGRVYTIAELGKSFTEYVKYQKPLYPKDKSEFMRSLTLYCQRLHYEQQLHFEAVMAMALHFNSQCGFGNSHREVMKKAGSMFNLDMSEWKVKLNDEQLKQAHSQGGTKRAEQVRAKFKTKREEALILRADGMILKDIATKLEVSLITVKRWKLPEC